MCGSFGGCLVSERARFKFSKDYAIRSQLSAFLETPSGVGVHTPQPIHGPLLKLLESDVGGGRCGVEVQTMRVLRFLVRRVCELFLAVVEDISPLYVDAIHGGCSF